ncbi:hypothetical protein GCM10027059_25670 [Myceligenerans halotolerans]
MTHERDDERRPPKPADSPDATKPSPDPAAEREATDLPARAFWSADPRDVPGEPVADETPGTSMSYLLDGLKYMATFVYAIVGLWIFAMGFVWLGDDSFRSGPAGAILAIVVGGGSFAFCVWSILAVLRGRGTGESHRRR